MNSLILLYIILSGIVYRLAGARRPTMELWECAGAVGVLGGRYWVCTILVWVWGVQGVRGLGLRAFVL